MWHLIYITRSDGENYEHHSVVVGTKRDAFKIADDLVKNVKNLIRLYIDKVEVYYDSEFDEWDFIS